MKKTPFATMSLALISLASVASAADFYARGDVGYAVSRDASLTERNATDPDAVLVGPNNRVNGNFGRSAAVTLGAGYRVSPLLRAEAALSYLPGLDFSGTDNQGAGDRVKGDVKSLVGMASVYADIGQLLGTGLINP